VIIIDARCYCARCEAHSQNIYRMVGSCRNCGTQDILMLFRVGDPATARDCPICGCFWTVAPVRKATPDEIPAAADAPEAEK
jgi:hypothetical protein